MIPPTAEQLLAALPTLDAGYQLRPGQMQMTQAIARAIARQRPLLVEGGTGVGKSLAYLIPAALAATTTGARVLIATSHKHLQDQLIKKDLPRVNSLLTQAGLSPVTAATLKGLTNYVCQVGVEETRAALDDPEELPAFLEWLRASDHHGEFEEIPFALSRSFQARVSTDSGECLHRRCPHYARCWAQAARQRAAAASIVITNHMLLALHLASDGHILPGQYDILIIDEAHAFEEAATAALGGAVSVGAIRRVLSSVLLKQHSDPELLAAAANVLDTLDEHLQERLYDAGGPVTVTEPLEPALRLVPLLTALTQPLPGAPQHPPGILTDGGIGEIAGEPVSAEEAALERLRARLEGVQARLHFCAQVTDPNHVYFLEATGTEGPHRPGWVLQAQPITVAAVLAEWWAQQPTTICTSATLSTGQAQSFTFMANRLGLFTAETVTVPSPFDYLRRTRLVLTPVAGQEGSSQGYYAALAHCMTDLLEAASGKALLLFTSNRALEAVWNRLADEPRLATWRRLRQGAAPAALLTETLRSAPLGARIVVCATRSWWQGVDVPGLRLVAMDKLPFPQMGHPLTEARLAHLERGGGRAFPQFMLPQALITFRQGFGRLMRSERDFGAVAICDARLDRQAYGRQFVQALPATIPILRSARELHAWIAQMEAGLTPASPVGSPPLIPITL